jgi:DNA-binding response OmpR family regulator
MSPVIGTRRVTHAPESARICLVAEDQALIAMLIQDQLEESGFGVAGPFASCSTALAWLKSNTPALALIDYMLSDGPCRELARELQRRNVPFAVLSGYGQHSPPNESEWTGIAWLQKPITLEPLRRAILGLLPAPSTR